MAIYCKKILAALLLAGILLLGLVKPISSNDTIIILFLFSYTSFLLLAKQIKSWHFLLLLIPLNLYVVLIFSQLSIYEFPTLVLLMDVFVGFLVADVVLMLPKQKYVLLIPIIVTVLMLAIANGGIVRSLLSQNPDNESYATDMMLFLKTYYNMDALPYYEAFKEAYRGHILYDNQYVPQGIWGWRLPTVFYLWRIIPITNGVVIYWLFLIFSLVTIIFSYLMLYELLGKKYNNIALLCPYLLISFLHLPFRNWTLLQTEWWSVLPLTISSLLLLQRKKILGIILLTLSVCVRVQSIIPVTIMTLYGIMQTKNFKNRLVLLIPVMVFFGILLFHYQQINIQLDNQSSVPQFDFRLNGSITLLKNSLAFGKMEYYFQAINPISWLLIVTFIGLVINFKKKHVILLSYYVLMLSYLLIGTSQWNNVWGVLYIFPILSFLPLALAKIYKLLKI